MQIATLQKRFQHNNYEQMYLLFRGRLPKDQDPDAMIPVRLLQQEQRKTNWLKEQKKALEENCAKAESALSRVTRDRDQLKSLLSVTEDRLRAADTENSQLKEELQHTSRDYAALEVQAEEAMQKAAEVPLLKEEVGELRRQLAETQQEYVAQENTLRQQDAQLKSLRESNQELRSSSETATRERERAIESLAQAQQAEQEVTDSFARYRQEAEKKVVRLRADTILETEKRVREEMLLEREQERIEEEEAKQELVDKLSKMRAPPTGKEIASFVAPHAERYERQLMLMSDHNVHEIVNASVYAANLRQEVESEREAAIRRQQEEQLLAARQRLAELKQMQAGAVKLAVNAHQMALMHRCFCALLMRVQKKKVAVAPLSKRRSYDDPPIGDEFDDTPLKGVPHPVVPLSTLSAASTGDLPVSPDRLAGADAGGRSPLAKSPRSQKRSRQVQVDLPSGRLHAAHTKLYQTFQVLYQRLGGDHPDSGAAPPGADSGHRGHVKTIAKAIDALCSQLHSNLKQGAWNKAAQVEKAMSMMGTLRKAALSGDRDAVDNQSHLMDFLQTHRAAMSFGQRMQLDAASKDVKMQLRTRMERQQRSPAHLTPGEDELVPPQGQAAQRSVSPGAVAAANHGARSTTPAPPPGGPNFPALAGPRAQIERQVQNKFFKTASGRTALLPDDPDSARAAIMEAAGLLGKKGPLSSRSPSPQPQQQQQGAGPLRRQQRPPQVGTATFDLPTLFNRGLTQTAVAAQPHSEVAARVNAAASSRRRSTLAGVVSEMMPQQRQTDSPPLASRSMHSGSRPASRSPGLDRPLDPPAPAPTTPALPDLPQPPSRMRSASQRSGASLRSVLITGMFDTASSHHREASDKTPEAKRASVALRALAPLPEQVPED
eukprot:TRINITY_DN4371_c0_g1_i2.p1 TRINITY_DN4371_c0_g1~~TRINITY_DN4371_c0_g1_i2.p1  ORF type:complete len:1008 (+),score=359.66 TRINITY_DN4371_c0_g1_i2:359-3025(+)